MNIVSTLLTFAQMSLLTIAELIKAFAAKAPEKALDTVQTLGSKYNAIVEDDQQIHANGNAF